MRYKILSVRDRATDAFSQPFFAASVGAAVRGFADEVNRAAENNQVYKHPDDFDLYLLGEFDDATGTFECGTPKQVAVGKDLTTKG